ncbi:MAG: LPS export ABC transporter ATP-binding protein [Myxococcales bacterium]|nr:LPS export ABC transporter ATP-binding protein [Myxococcales bacterium]
MNPPPPLVARCLRKVYAGRAVVDGISFEVGAGEILGLLGPNGAGKSTVFRILAGVERGDGGTVSLGGVPVDGLPLDARARRGLGYLPQEDSLFRDLSVRDNVALALQVSGRPGAPAAFLARVGIAGLAHRAVSGLSGGERRRLQIARLLAIQPSVILLDEPFAGLDPAAIQGLQVIFRELAQGGVGVLLTDHAVRETLATVDRAILIDAGVIQAQGTPAEVAGDPHARARYFGSEFRLD